MNMIDNYTKMNDMNFMIVSTIEEFGYRHQISTAVVFELFKKNHLFDMIRSQYDVLHTLPLSESTDMAESLLKKQGVEF